MSSLCHFPSCLFASPTQPFGTRSALTFSGPFVFCLNQGRTSSFQMRTHSHRRRWAASRTANFFIIQHTNPPLPAPERRNVAVDAWHGRCLMPPGALGAGGGGAAYICQGQLMNAGTRLTGPPPHPTQKTPLGLINYPEHIKRRDLSSAN